MITIADIRLITYKRARTMVRTYSQGCSDEGSITVAIPDEFSVRELHLTQHKSNGTSTVVNTVAVETLAKLLISPDGSTAIGISDDDFYIFSNKCKKRFLNDRRLLYHDIALSDAANFAVITSDLVGNGYSLALAEVSGRLLWMKDFATSIEHVAITQDGKRMAVTDETGMLTVLSDDRSTLYTVHTDINISCLSIGGSGVVTVAGKSLSNHQYVIQVVDALGEITGTTCVEGNPIAVANSASGNRPVIAITTGDQTGKVLFGAEGGDHWQLTYDTGPPTGLSMSPNGKYLAVTTRDGGLWQYELDTSSSAIVDVESTFQQSRKLLDQGDFADALHLMVRALYDLQADPHVIHLSGVFVEDVHLASAEYTKEDIIRGVQRLTYLCSTCVMPSFLVRLITDMITRLISSLLIRPTEENLETCFVDLGSINELLALCLLPADIIQKVVHFKIECALCVLGVMQKSIDLGSFRRALDTANDAAVVQISSAEVSDLRLKLLSELSLQEANRCYDTHDFAGALFGYRKILRWIPDNLEVLNRIRHAESMLSDSGLQDRFSRLE